MVDNRVTQIPVITVDLSNQPVRVTQIPVQAISLPVQPARITQLPAMVPHIPRPVPEPALLIPMAPVEEELLFITAVNRARSSKEQRVRLRQTPRHRYAYLLHLRTDEDRRRAYAFAYKYQHREFINPLYHHWARLTDETEPSSDRLYFDPSETDLRVDEQLAIFDVYSMEVSTHRIAELFSDGARLEEAVGRPVGGVHAVCPAIPTRFVRTPLIEMAESLGELRVTLETTQPRSFLRTPDYVLPSLGGIPILDQEPINAQEEELNRGTEWLDTGLATPAPRTNWRAGLVNGRREYRLDRDTDMDFWRALLDHMGGRQRTIRVPTYFNDLPLAEVPALGATEVVTSNIQAYEYLMAGSYRAISLWRGNGLIHREVINATMNYTPQGDPVSVTLKLNSGIGSGAGANVIRRVSYLNRMRLAEDSVRFEHHQNYSTVALNLQAVNQ